MSVLVMRGLGRRPRGLAEHEFEAWRKGMSVDLDVSSFVGGVG